MKFHDFMTQNLLSQNNRMSHLRHTCVHEVMKYGTPPSRDYFFKMIIYARYIKMVGLCSSCMQLS